MHTETTPAEQDRQTDRTILSLLLDPEAQRPWAVEELIRAVGDRLAVTDAVPRLATTGLIHRLDGFVFASRAAIHASEITVGVL